jgi:hypothetical protein
VFVDARAFAFSAASDVQDSIELVEGGSQASGVGFGVWKTGEPDVLLSLVPTLFQREATARTRGRASEHHGQVGFVDVLDRAGLVCRGRVFF